MWRKKPVGKPSKAWKEGERRVAAIFGVKRTPLSGGSSGHTRSDTLHPRLFIEIKHRKKQAVISLFRETKDLAKKEGKLPIVVLHETGQHMNYCVVPLEREYLMAILEEMDGHDVQGS